MIPRYRPPPTFNNFLVVKDSNYVELVSKLFSSAGTDYRFDANFYLKSSIFSLNGQNLTSDYQKVVITVKKRASDRTFSSNLLKTVQDSLSSVPTSPPSSAINANSLNRNYGFSLQSYRDSVENRVYSGLQIVADAGQQNSDVISRQEVSLSIDTTTLSKPYLVTSLVRDTSDYQPTVNSDPLFPLEDTDLIEDVNYELTDVTESVYDNYSSNEPIRSPVNHLLIDAYSILLGKRPNSLYAAMTKYYLDTVGRSTNETNFERYVKTNIGKQLEEIDFSATFRISSDLQSEVFDIVFELYKKDTNLPVETVVKVLDVQKHVDAFESIQYPPIVSCLPTPSSVFLSITDDQRNSKVTSLDSQNVRKFNIYAKDIRQDKSVSSYRFLGEIQNSAGVNSFSFIPTSSVTVVRAVPVDNLGRESNLYTNVLTGESYEVIGTPTLICKPSQDCNHTLIVRNIPKDSSKCSLKKRRNNTEPYVVIDSADLTTNSDTETIEFIDDDNPPSPGTGPQSYVDYVAEIELSSGTRVITNEVLQRNVAGTVPDNNVSVKLEEFKALSVGNDYEVSFKLTTRVTQSENQRIIDTFKNNPQYREIYEQLSNASNTAAQGTGTSTPDQPTLYNSLYVHEVIRTDLNTGERATFDLLTDGTFTDDADSRSIYGISPINPYHEYLYQVITYVKDPLTLFRKYVKKVTVDGHSYYYLPYKWDNTAFSPNMPERDEEDLPIISAADNFRTNPIGQTAEITLRGLLDFAKITEVITDRIDRNTIKITWNFDVADYSLYYDSFVVMKNVNMNSGFTRSFIGRTRLNYMYHEIDEGVLGSVYYTIVPVTQEFDIDDAAHSDIVKIDVDGILDPQPLPPSYNIPTFASGPRLTTL